MCSSAFDIRFAAICRMRVSSPCTTTGSSAETSIGRSGWTTRASLTASVRELGVLQPITVRYLLSEDIYQIISGERRYQAACAAGLQEMPCWVQSPQENAANW